ncbi:outer membrane beta-barrel protein [Pontibacter sp. 172403-2]|uniref:outer membrane beta-barrel protein n=1 Tax=Pontibacter rufus TaxID=2791028 RepID=UPI0018AF58AE|nr:outer membrane beta-barrel protein [Pontibacter sp. 172403-2]MBF9254413.1 outer membrane beta-barrel protein [Pontibacter sp. 172403-2]
MKKLYLLVVICGWATLAQGQKLEITAQLHTGVSKFGGASAASSSFILVSDVAGSNSYTINPYGRGFGLNYGAGAQLQLVTDRRLLLGAQVAVEQLRSRINIGGIYSFRSDSRAEGHATLQSNFLNLQPYLGRRLYLRTIEMDLTLGTDIGFCLKSTEHGQATDAYGNDVTTSLERHKPAIDFRPRLGIAAYRKHLGLAFSYAHGLTNYTSGYEGANSEVYARVLRLGLLYRL